MRSSAAMATRVGSTLLRGLVLRVTRFLIGVFLTVSLPDPRRVSQRSGAGDSSRGSERPSAPQALLREVPGAAQQADGRGDAEVETEPDDTRAGIVREPLVSELEVWADREGTEEEARVEAAPSAARHGLTAYGARRLDGEASESGIAAA